MNKPTDLAFHKEMKEAVMFLCYLDYDVVFKQEDILSRKDIFKFILNYLWDDNQETEMNALRTLSYIDYDVAKEISGKEDRTYGSFVVPFWYDYIIDDVEVISDTQIRVLSREYYETNSANNVVIAQKLRNSSILSLWSNGYLDIKKDDQLVPDTETKRLFRVSYEFYGMGIVDSGSYIDVLASNFEESISIASNYLSPPEDGTSWSFESYDIENKFYMDEIGSPYSYLNAVERPGIAAAEAMSS